MIKWIHSKIGAQLLITVSVVLVLSMVSLIYIATQLVAEFGEFSASRNETNIRENANAFLAHITHEQAMRYESTFKTFAASSAVIAKQAAFLLENIAFHEKTPLKPNEKLVIYPHNGIFSNDRSEKTMVLYWGSPAMSPGISEQINTLSHLDPILEVVKESNIESTACYAVTEPGIARYYPNIHGVEQLPPTTKFDIRNANWYVIAKPENNLDRTTVWSNIYLDSVGHGLMITASTPIYSKGGQYLGATGVDVTLDTIVNNILTHIPSCHRMEGMFSFLVDNQGRIIAFPPEYLDMFEIKIDQDKLVDATVVLKHSLLNSSNAEIRKIGQNMYEKNYHVSNFALKGRPYIISSHFMPSTGWRLGTVVPESSILASVQETRNALGVTVEKMTNRFTLLTVLFLITSIIVIAILSIKYFIRPLDKLSKGALRVKEGDLTTHVAIHTKNEIGSLAKSFNTMVDTLREAKEREKEYTQTLEQKVKDRTQEIMTKNEYMEKTLQELKQEFSERRKAEKALRESEKRFRTAAESASDLIYEWDIASDHLEWFGDIDSALGFKPGKFERTIEAWLALIHPDDQDRIATAVSNHRESAEPLYVEYNIRRVDGTWRYWTDRGSVIMDDMGKPCKLVGVCTDVTEHKRAKKEQKKLEAQLQRAQKMEAIGTLAGGVAHDLNNILSGLVSYPELLLMDLPEKNPLRKPILTIQRSGQKAAAIVQDLLTLARRGISISEVVNLNTIISEQLKSPEFKKLISFNPEAQVETHFEKDLLNIKGSTVHLSKTMMNLFSNAVEAMVGGGRLFISTENLYIDRPMRGYDHVEEGDYATITISDTGIGISEGDMERMFEPFYTKKVMGRSGTGLGMAVVWGTIKDHKGYINVESTEGQGTTFTLYFPATRKELPGQEEALPIEEYIGKGASIVVVDDVEEQREIASRILKKLGYAVTAVASGQETVEYMKNNSADLLVLDMIMDPGIDGLTTYRKILELHPAQKAIIASGFSETERVKEVQRLGAGTYVRKPYTLEKIGLAVRKELEK